MFVETYRQTEEWEGLIVKNGEGFRYAANGGFQYGKIVGGLTRSGVSYGISKR